MRHTYWIEVLGPLPGGGASAWQRGGGYVGREWGLGYLQARREAAGPKLALRLVREDGKVVEETAACSEATIGAHAGMPGGRMYARAAEDALYRAVLDPQIGTPSQLFFAGTAKRLREWRERYGCDT